MAPPPPPPAVSSGDTLKLKREDCHRTKHDSAFSKWQILTGPSDWSDYLSGKQGAERYRVQNLPSRSGPGLYEIGIAVWPTGSGREVGKLDPHDIVVVYLGEADNVRSRLQCHGRGDSHLENGCGGGDFSNMGIRSGSANHVGSGLFRDIFSRGYPIVYRWAPMNSKIDAKRSEAQLLGKFDYAWNKVENGSRRPSDVLQKIDKIASQTFRVPRFFKRLQSLREKQLGIPIKPSQTLPLEEGNASDNTEEKSYSLLAQVFKFGRSRPRPVFNKPSILEERTLTYSCGAADPSDGSICNSSGSGIHHQPHCSSAEDKCRLKITDAHPYNKDKSPITCGVLLLDGSPCMEKPLCGRKRCEDHKGRRITQSTIIPCRYMISDDTSSHDYDSSTMEPAGAASEIRSSSSVVAVISPDSCYCGVILSDGSYCKHRPVKGRKRCEGHKGMRVHGLVSKLSSRGHI
ncbi:hypothetical protein Dimus_026711 [Dionaea muscipula]